MHRYVKLPIEISVRKLPSSRLPLCASHKHSHALLNAIHLPNERLSVDVELYGRSHCYAVERQSPLVRSHQVVLPVGVPEEESSGGLKYWAME